MREKKGAPPSHRLFVVKDSKGDKDYWIRIGSAWPHKSGTGFNIKLDALPPDGRLVMLDYSDEPEDSTQH